MKTLFTFLFLTFASQSLLAETLHIGRFASPNLNEDESIVKIESMTVTAFATTSGASLSLPSCNDGRQNEDGERSIFGKSFINITMKQVLPIEIINERKIEIPEASEALNKLKSALKKKTSKLCHVEALISIDLNIRIKSTNRLTKSSFLLRPIEQGLVVETIREQYSIQEDIDLFEIL